jgi:glucose-6-phosphate isomerase, archaeal
MSQNLSEINGFPLFFNPTTLVLETSPNYAIKRSSRYLSDLVEVMFSPDSLPLDVELFHLDHLINAPTDELSILKEKDLAYGFTILPARMIGREFVKTHGHSHPSIIGKHYSFPEIYAQISGLMWLFLQKHHPDDLSVIEECYLIKMQPGDKVLIPPNYAHMQINPSPNEPSITAGLYSQTVKPEFGFYKQKKGFAYYILDKGDDIEVLQNPNYSHHPPMIQLNQTTSTIFQVDDPLPPLWISLMKTPGSYGFLSNPSETAYKFSIER